MALHPSPAAPRHPLPWGAAIVLALFSCGCLQAPPEAKPVALATHVSDWRDEVLYQVLVDRFADGDVNNDYNVSPGHLSRYQGGDWRGLKIGEP